MRCVGLTARIIPECVPTLAWRNGRTETGQGSAGGLLSDGSRALYSSAKRTRARRMRMLLELRTSAGHKVGDGSKSTS